MDVSRCFDVLLSSMGEGASAGAAMTAAGLMEDFESFRGIVDQLS